MTTTDVALHEGQHRDMQITSPIGNDPTGGRLVAWAEGLAAAHRIGTALCQTTFVPAHFRGKPEEAAAAILYGDEIGFTPTQSLQNLYVIGGKPALYARAMVALVQAAGHAVWTVEKTDEAVTVAGIRRGTSQEVRETWTLARAQRAGYTNNKKYQTDPQAMLYARAASDVCRQVAADVLAGIGYSVEEMQLVEDRPAVEPPRSTGMDALRGKVHATQVAAGPPAGAESGEESGFDPQPAPATNLETGEAITPAQLKALHAGLADIGLGKASNRATALAFYGNVIGRRVESSKDLTKAEASAILDEIAAEKDRAPEAGEQA